MWKTSKAKRFKKRSNRRPFKKRYGIRVKNGKTIHYFKRTYVQTVAVNSANAFTAITSDGTNYNNFKLSQLTNYADFTSLYDQFKICGIARKYVFDRNSSEAQATVISSLPRLITVNDWNDTSALANENEALEYANCKQSRLDRVVKRYFRPQPLADPTGYANFMSKRWLPTASYITPHSGIKEALVLNSTSSVALGNLNIYTTFYIACKNPK